MYLIASGNNNVILTSPDGSTWTTRHAADASSNTLVDQAWDGGNNYVVVGGSQLWSSTDGGLTFVSRTLPANTGFGLITDPSGVGKIVIWDGAQFVCCGWVNSGGGALQGVVGTSPTGVTWTWANVADSYNPYSIAVLNGRYVILDNRNFHTPAQKTRFYSALAPLGTWTLEFTSTLSNRYAWFGAAPAGFIAFGGGQSTQTFIAYSADGISWAENGSGMAVIYERGQVYFDPISDRWIIAGILPNGDVGIGTTPTGAVITSRLDLGAFSGGGPQGSVIRGASGVLVAPFGDIALPANTQTLYQSIDNGTTWGSAGGEGSPAMYAQNMVFAGTVYAALQNQQASPFFYGLSSSPTALPPWTQNYDDTANANLLILRLYEPLAPPPPPSRCVDFELESPGDMPDSGQQFECQRLLLTVNCNVSGVPQVLTPILIIDGVEHTLPQITTTARQTLDIPIYGFHGRLFDGVRLDGCLTGRVEVFRIEATVWLGE